jgi:hypothetical protein
LLVIGSDLGYLPGEVRQLAVKVREVRKTIGAMGKNIFVESCTR